MKVSKIKTNMDNPRICKDDKFKKLVKSIREFPKMMELRPIVVDADNMILGGNMRLKAIQELGMKDIPDTWVKRADELTEDEKRRFIISDNSNFGEWDMNALANAWEVEELEAWGVDSPSFDDKGIDLDEMVFDGNKDNMMIIRVECSDEVFNGLKRDIVMICRNYKNAKVL